MKLEEILAHWEEDSKVDTTEIAQEAMKISTFHHKYFKMFLVERTILKKMKEKLQLTRRFKWRYYTGKCSLEECRAEGIEQFQEKFLTKDDITLFINSDKDIIRANIEIAEQENKTDLLEGILKHLVNRGYNLKTAMDFIKYSEGM